MLVFVVRCEVDEGGFFGGDEAVDFPGAARGSKITARGE